MSEALCSPSCRCRRCVELLHERALKKQRNKRLRFQARAAGIASGRSRRRKAIHRRGLTGAQQAGLPLEYEIRRISRREFDERYLKAFPPPERPTALASYYRCKHGVWAHLLSVWGLLSVKGQHCRTTQPQRASGLLARGVSRSVRTLYSYNRRLEAMGIATVLHVRKPAPKRDCLAIEWHITRRLTCRPPTGTGNPPSFLRGSPRSVKVKNRIEPTSSADNDPPDKPAERPITEDDGVAAEIRFLQLKLDSGFGGPTVHDRLKRELAELKRRSRAKTEPGSAQSPPEDSDDRYSGP